MAHTIRAEDHLASVSEDGFTYAPTSGLTYEGFKRRPTSELRKLFGFETADEVTTEAETLTTRDLLEKLREFKIPCQTTDPSTLRQLFVTGSIRNIDKMRRAGQAMPKKELAAQLKLYGVDFDGRLGATKVRELLLESIRSGRCDTPTRNVQALEKYLENKFKKLDKAHIEEIAQKRQEEFDKKYPEPKVAYLRDPKMFLSRYFLSPDGRPDKSKTRHPIIISQCPVDTYLRILEAIRALIKTCYSDLHCQEEGPPGGEKVIAVGWGFNAVSEAVKAAAKPLFERQEEEDKKQAEERMASHLHFVAGLSQDRISCNLKNIQGRYLVLCDDIQTRWPNDVRKSEGLSMRIIPEVGSLRRNLVADFRFGAMEGLMRFRPAEIMPARRRIPYGTTLGKEEVDGDKPPLHICSPSRCSFLKRKASDSNTNSPVSKKPRSTLNPDKPGTEKFKLIFEYRAREAVEGDLCRGFGWIEWDLNDCTTFQGEFNLGLIGMCVPFSGYKTNLLRKGMKPRSEWGDYTPDTRYLSHFFR